MTDATDDTDELRAKIARLEAKVEHQGETIAEQADRIDHQGETIIELEADNERLNDENDSLREHNRRITKELAGAQKRISALEEGSDDSAENDDTGDDRAAWTPMTYILNNESDAVVNDLTPSDRRAKTIAEHFAQWSTKAPNGMVIRDGLKELLSTATGERLEWSQVVRACEHLAELTKGAIALKRTSKHGNVVIAQTDDHRLRPLLASGG